MGRIYNKIALNELRIYFKIKINVLNLKERKTK